MKNLTRSQDEPFDERMQEVQDGLTDLHHVSVPSMPMRFDPAAVGTPDRSALVRRGWRPALLGTAAAAGLAIFLVGPALFGGSTQNVSAEQVLERTREVSTADPLVTDADRDSYHLVSRSETTGPHGSMTVTEVWFDNEGRQRSETRDAATGELLSGFLKTGDDMWFYSEAGGDLTAVHNSLRDGSFSVGVGVAAQIGFGAGSLSDVLNTFTNECTDARLAGEETVAGRQTYLIEVTPTPDTCDIRLVEDPEVGGLVVEGEPDGATVVTRSSDGDEGEIEVSIFGSDQAMRMWVDQETFMTLKSESGFGDISVSYEVTSLDLGVDFSDQPGLFELPEDARIVEAGSPEAGGIGFQVYSTEAGTSVELKQEGISEISVDFRPKP